MHPHMNEHECLDMISAALDAGTLDASAVARIQQLAQRARVMELDNIPNELHDLILQQTDRHTQLKLRSVGRAW